MQQDLRSFGDSREAEVPLSPIPFFRSGKFEAEALSTTFPLPRSTARFSTSVSGLDEEPVIVGACTEPLQ